MTVRRVSPQDAKSLLDEGYLYLDVRTTEEFEAGHPTGAYNVPIATSGPMGMRPNAHFLDELAAIVPKDAKIVVGCKAGGRSMQAAHLMLQAGYSDVIDQRAGFGGANGEAGWGQAGLPTTRGRGESGKNHDEIAKKRKA